MQIESLKNLDPSKHVVFVGGATATGKTDLGVQIARQYGGAVISADSRQVYLEMDIGTAKAVAREPMPESTDGLWEIPVDYEGVDHYLIDIVRPDERYTTFDFKEHAYELISRLQSAGKLPVVVGGTGLYLEALIKNYEITGDRCEDVEIKKELEARIAEEGPRKLWEELNEVDPEAASQIHHNNPRYIIRALELYRLTGKAKGESAKQSTPPFEPVMIGINYPREHVYERVELRIDQQFEQGIIEETKALYEKYDADLPALTSLGYKEIKQYLDGELSLEECKDLFKQNTRRFSKRQMTWFRRYEDMIWIDPK